MLNEMLTELELRQNERHGDFLALARKVAAGEKVSAPAVERLLAELGKTPADLRAAVELFAQRARWHEQRRRGALLEKERASVQNRIAAEDRKLAAAEKAHEEATGPLYAKMQEIKQAISDASDARRKLFETCPDTSLRAEFDAASKRLNEVRAQAMALRERTELVKQADRDEETATQLLAGLVPGASTARIDHMKAQAQRKREAGLQAVATLAVIEQRIAGLEQEEAAIFERMTAP